MEVNAAFIEALFYLSLIIMAPVIFKVSRILTKYVLNRYVRDAEITVTYKHSGAVVRVEKIKTTGYVVDQLKACREALDVRG